MNDVDRVYVLADRLLDVIQPELDREPRQMVNIVVILEAVAAAIGPMLAEPAACEIWEEGVARPPRPRMVRR
jgi:hypothetical protein